MSRPERRVLSAAHLQHLHQLEAAKSNELEAQKEKELEPLDFDFSGSLVVQKEEAKVLPVIETEAKARPAPERGEPLACLRLARGRLLRLHALRALREGGAKPFFSKGTLGLAPALRSEAQRSAAKLAAG